MTIADTATSDERARTNRDALAGSAFAQLLDAFFVSLGGLAGEARVFAGIAAGMAVFGLFVTSQLLPEVIRAGNWARNSPVRTSNILMPITSILVYTLQLVFAVGVLLATNNTTLLRLSVLVMLGLYAGAIATLEDHRDHIAPRSQVVRGLNCGRRVQSAGRRPSVDAASADGKLLKCMPNG